LTLGTTSCVRHVGGGVNAVGYTPIETSRKKKEEEERSGAGD